VERTLVEAGLDGCSCGAPAGGLRVYWSADIFLRRHEGGRFQGASVVHGAAADSAAAARVRERTRFQRHSKTSMKREKVKLPNRKVRGAKFLAPNDWALGTMRYALSPVCGKHVISCKIYVLALQF
jgi:hypothetical protein